MAFKWILISFCINLLAAGNVYAQERVFESCVASFRLRTGMNENLRSAKFELISDTEASKVYEAVAGNQKARIQHNSGRVILNLEEFDFGVATIKKMFADAGQEYVPNQRRKLQDAVFVVTWTRRDGRGQTATLLDEPTKHVLAIKAAASEREIMELERQKPGGPFFMYGKLRDDGDEQITISCDEGT